MSAQQAPSPRQFVVRVAEGGLDGAALEGSRPPEISGEATLDDRTLLVHLPGSEDPHATWQQLLEQFRSAEWVSPVVLDDDHAPHFPTGDVTVRFRHTPSDPELERFAASNDLELRARNEFVAQQASFRPLDPRGTYLPDLVERLEGEDGVGMAWLNTKSAYTRR